ncbi:hypothetical protein HU773_004465 [Pseudomonas shahriarae]|uniref:restriction endonuclease subunit S n=1 Tax=Pseudomonas shahriarae TaxID=2745512 RepID=UPI001649274B|nr:restriction endonuclease subunit S [Pseudomonas shahriarae]QXH90139.1 hypothetical protein HU773_004465 [Pseudomonas shahriarae]
MSVDTLRETFHINRVAPDKIQDFLTAQTYRPGITEAKEKIKSLPWVFLQSVCKRPIRQGKSPSYAEDAGLLCIKPKNTNEMIVSLEELSYIKQASKDEVAGQRLQMGDIVITRSGSGTIGRASIFLSEKEVYTNDHLFIVRTDAVDSHYTCAFLNTYWGHRLLEAGVSGSTGQLNLSNEHIKGITLYTPAELAQKYIGDKIRQAERLRAWAKALEAKFELNLKKAVSEAFENKGAGKKYSRAPVADISYTLNPGAFDEERLRVQHYLLGLGGKRFSKLADISGPTSSSYKPDATYIGLDAISSATCQLKPSTVEKAEISGTCRLLGEGPVISKLRPYLNKISYIPKRFVGAVGSTELLCITPRDHYSGWYLYGVLKSELALKQLRPLATGATHPRIDQYDVYDLVVPVLDEQETLGQALEIAQSAYFLASELTVAAKLLVEALIEGQLTEAELLTAEKALQAGNDRLDRFILSRLNTNGIDGQGSTLFNDLDELYCLLVQAEGD